jgi:hypothetical protein
MRELTVEEVVTASILARNWGSGRRGRHDE